MQVVCRNCGEVFETEDGRIKFCSDECSKAYRRKYNTERVKVYRQTSEDYRKRVNANNTRRYYERKHNKFVELAEQINNYDGDMNGLVKLLEENFRLRH